MPEPIPFTALGARSRSFVWGLSIVMVVESVALHALLLKRWPWFSLVLALLNAYTVWWLVQDYRSVGELPTLVRPDDLLVRLGKRAHAAVPYANVASVERPSWQAIPTDVMKGYLKLSGSDDPNVLLRFTQPVPFTMMFGLRKAAGIVGLRLDEPDAFVREVESRRTPVPRPG